MKNTSFIKTVCILLLIALTLPVLGACKNQTTTDAPDQKTTASGEGTTQSASDTETTAASGSETAPTETPGEKDPMDMLDFTYAQSISDHGCYQDGLRVKTSGELLFSPTFPELQWMISGGDTDKYTAYLSFTLQGDEEYTFPTVAVKPAIAKGSWVDFFLQGANIDCGFCPTAGETYGIELALVEDADPLTVLFHDYYTMTAAADYADSVYYDPTPVGGHPVDRAYTLRYEVSSNGKIEGSAVQRLKAGEKSTKVTAVPNEGFVFIAWSDGVTTAERSGDTVTKNTILTARFEFAGLVDMPTVYLYSGDGQPIFNRTYAGATMVLSPGKGEADVSYNIEVKGRGNSSWGGTTWLADYDSKNSYSIKLEEKAQLLGLGKGPSRKWVLNANKFDVSAMRNWMMWELARKMGTIPFVPDCAWVRLYINGEYRGLYVLSEKVNTSQYRVDVDDSATGNPDKGYLIELDFRGNTDLSNTYFYVEGYGPDIKRKVYDAVEFVIKSDVEGKQDVEFIKSYMERVHAAIMGGDRAEIEELVDFASFLDMYIIEELSKDCDSGRASCYISKPAGGKIYFTAPWDFDFGFGTYGPAQTTYGFVSEGDECCTWYASLIQRDWFKEAVHDRMNELSDELEELFVAMRAKGDEIRPGVDENAEFWGLYGNHVHQYVSWDVSYGLNDFNEHLDYIENWIRDRWEWMLEN